MLLRLQGRKGSLQTRRDKKQATVPTNIASQEEKRPVTNVGKNSLIMKNPDLILRKSILTKNDAITQQK
jgi:hypothetical protein